MKSSTANAQSGAPVWGRIGSLLLPYLVLVLIHLLSGLQMQQPLILADEVGYLGNARYLSGAAHLPDMRGTGFYHFGYSLFLFPAFWLFAEPLWIYKAAIAINALLISALYFPLRAILTTVAQVRAGPARWIAFACCLYPSLVLYSNIAWSENALVPLYAVAVALFGRMLARRSASDVLLFGLVAGFLYTVHPRALPIVAAALAYLLLLVIIRAISARHFLLGGLVMAAVLLPTRWVNGHLKAAGWAGGGEVSAAKLAVRLVPDSDFVALLERAFGQLLYLSLASHLLVLLGLVAMVWVIGRGIASGSLRRVVADPITGVPLFILVTSAGVFAASCTLKLYALHGLGGLRGADFIHGRYNEALAVLAIAFALASIVRSGADTRRLVGRVVFVSAVTLCLAVVVMAEVDDSLVRHVAGQPGVEPQERIPASDVDAVAVPGVYPLVGMFGALKLVPISLVSIALFILITVALRRSLRGGLALLMLLFLFFAQYNYRHYLRPRMARAEPRLALAAEVNRLGPVATLSFDAGHREPGLVPAMQFLLGQTVFERFDSRAGEEPGSPVVLAGNSWSQADRLGASFVRATGRGGALWLLPEAHRPKPSAAGYLGVTLGVERRLELRETGFYRRESFEGVPGRWTDGTATLTVPLDPLRAPRTLVVETLAPGRDGTPLQILANGVELGQEVIPRGAWSRRFSLAAVPLGEELLLELKSDTFSPADVRASSNDRRRLGVVVTGIRLLGSTD